MITVAQIANHRRPPFRVLTGLVWLALPAISVVYLHSWNHLPSRVATHFDLANGWTPRAWALGLFLLLGSLVAALTAWLGSRVRKPDPTAWATLSR